MYVIDICYGPIPVCVGGMNKNNQLYPDPESIIFQFILLLYLEMNEIH